MRRASRPSPQSHNARSRRAAPPRAAPRASAAALLALALAYAVPAPLAAASLAGSPTFVPAVYGPGEEVLAIAPIAPRVGEALAEMELEPGSGLPVQQPSADPELRSLRIVKGPAGWEMRIRFVPWSPGKGLVPALSVRGASLPALSFEALPRLGPEDLDPTPPRPQRLPPGAALAFYLAMGTLAAVALAAFGFAAYVLPASRALLARRRAGQAFKRLGRSLDYLAAQAGSAEPAAYSAALARAFRNYLAARARAEVPSLTPGEISALPDAAFAAPSIRDGAASLLAWSDDVRFGGASAGARALADAAERARRIAAENEEALLARP